jgi:hypothetical protein
MLQRSPLVRLGHPKKRIIDRPRSHPNTIELDASRDPLFNERMGPPIVELRRSKVLRVRPSPVAERQAFKLEECSWSARIGPQLVQPRPLQGSCEQLREADTDGDSAAPGLSGQHQTHRIAHVLLAVNPGNGGP